jgi:hypothetical protein
VTLRAKPAVALLPVASPKPKRDAQEMGNVIKIPLMPEAATSVAT